MEVITASTAGFCFGVKRAVEKVYEKAADNTCGKKIYTYGPIIHNEEVVKDLENKGIHVINTKEELAELKNAVVIIRSHGVSKDVYELLEDINAEVVDATCPFVKKIHKIVREESEKGRIIIIIGNKKHPEVEGIMGWSSTDTYVIETPEQAEELSLSEEAKICIVSQTTFNYSKFNNIVAKIAEKSYDNNVMNTICSATHERQSEAKAVAAKADVMLVIGGKHSSNTQKLFEICKYECNHTYYIQTVDDIDKSWFQDCNVVGITAGASTPNNIIEEVKANVRIKF